MTGTKMARITACKSCIECRRCTAWQWMKCCIHDRTGDGPLARDIDDEFLEGPVANCPAGRWLGLVPEGPDDPEAYSSWLAERRIQAEREGAKPLFKLLLKDVDPAEVDARLEQAVEHYHLAPRIAVEISDELRAESEIEPVQAG